MKTDMNELNKELNLNELETVNGAWNWKDFWIGAGCAGATGALLGGCCAGPIGAIVGGVVAGGIMGCEMQMGDDHQ